MEEDQVFKKDIKLAENAIVHLKDIYKTVIFFCKIGFLVMVMMIVDVGYHICCAEIFPYKPYHLIIVLLFLAVFFLLYFLYRFSLSVKTAFKEDDPAVLATSFKYLKWHYKLLVVFLFSLFILICSNFFSKIF